MVAIIENAHLIRKKQKQNKEKQKKSCMGKICSLWPFDIAHIGLI